MASEKIDALELDITSKTSTENIDKLIDALSRLGNELNKLKSKTVKVDIQQTGEAAKSTSGNVDKLSNSFLNMAVKITAVIAIFKRLSDVISDGLSNSMDYIKTLNMFNISLGEYAESAGKYANTVRDAMGIDVADWQKAQGVFQTLIEGFGVGGDQAAYMSQQLTQLSYDIASFHPDLTTEQAINKVKAAVSGRIEPIRKLGWDISQGKLVDIAANPDNYSQTTYSVNQETGAIEANSSAIEDNTEHRIVNFNQLTQAEKVQLRYIALMTQETEVQGNFAKTLRDPSMQMKIFKEQTSMTARALGNIFIPALNQVMPYLTAFFKIMEDGFQKIAEFFGFEIPDMSDRLGVSDEVDYYDDIVEATGSAAKNAKKMKDYMLGIDELNVLRPDDGTSGGGGSSGSQSNLNGLYTPGYDFLSNAVENSIEQAKQDIEKFFNDLKEHPISLPLEILVNGAGELGSRIWELILGMTPEEFQNQARELGYTLGQFFCVRFAARMSELGSEIWKLILGKTPEELGEEAALHGHTVGQEFVRALSSKTWKAWGLESLFGTHDEIAQRAAEAGRTIGEQLMLQFAAKVAEMFASNPVLQEIYKIATGHDAQKDLEALQKKLSQKPNKSGNGNENTQARFKAENNAATIAYEYYNTSAEEARKAGETAVKAYASGMDSARGEVRSVANAVLNTAITAVNGSGKGGERYKNTAAEEARKYGEGLLSQKAYVNEAGTQLFERGYDGATGDGKAPAKYETASTTQATHFGDGLLSLKETIAQAGRELFNKGYSGATKGGDGKSEFSHAGASLASAFTDNLGSSYAKSEAYRSASRVADMGNEGVRYNKPEFTQAGRNAGSGYIGGIDAYRDQAITAGKTLAYNALNKLKQILGIKSPSREFAKAGMYSVLGYSNSIEDYTYKATDAVESMARSAVSAVNASNSMFTSNFALPSTSNSGYIMGAANGMAMADLASNIYQAIVSGMTAYGGNTSVGDIKVIIDGKEVFRTVQTEARKRGVSISNGAFSI